MSAFDLQATYARAWLDATAAGFATASLMGSALAHTMDAWSSAVRASNGRGSPVMSSWPMMLTSSWPWGAFAPFPHYGAAWPMSPVAGFDWMRAMGVGMTSYPAWDFAAAFAAPYRRGATPFWPLQLAHANTGWPVVASYRTASGHATSMLLRSCEFASTPAWRWPDLAWSFFRH